MATDVGYDVAEANDILAAMFRTAGFAAYQGPVGGYFIQLHTAEPGPNGTSNLANAGKRAALGAMSVPALGACHNLTVITFQSVVTPGGGTTTQTYNFYSAWTSISTGAGTFMFDGPCTGVGTNGQDVIADIGAIVARLNTDT